jgi:hypothetical protein
MSTDTGAAADTPVRRGTGEVADLRDELAQLRKDLRRLTALTEDMRRTVESLTGLFDGQKQDAKWRTIFRLQLAALLRMRYFDARGGLATSASIRARRFRLRSQNEEDGIVLALLEAAGVSGRRFVEIGSGGSGGNSAVLAEDLGWAGLMVEAGERSAAAAANTFRHNPGVSVVNKAASSDNINSLIRQGGFGGEVDLLSIDVDSIDYWLFDALEIPRVVSPRLIVCEYNALFGPTRAVTLPNAARPRTAPKSYVGASLAALTQVAERKGYRLVLCEDYGINAFFLRNDLAPEIPGCTAEQAFRPLRRRRGGEEDPPETFDAIAAADAAGLPLVDV